MWWVDGSLRCFWKLSSSKESHSGASLSALSQSSPKPKGSDSCKFEQRSKFSFARNLRFFKNGSSLIKERELKLRLFKRDNFEMCANPWSVSSICPLRSSYSRRGKWEHMSSRWWSDNRGDELKKSHGIVIEWRFRKVIFSPASSSRSAAVEQQRQISSMQFVLGNSKCRMVVVKYLLFLMRCLRTLFVKSLSDGRRASNVMLRVNCMVSLNSENSLRKFSSLNFSVGW